MVEKESLAGNPARQMRHRHTIDLDIPRQVAPLQSLTPLLQVSKPNPCSGSKQSNVSRFPLIRRTLESCQAKVPQSPPAGDRDLTVEWMPLKNQKTRFGRPRGKYVLTSFFL